MANAISGSNYIGHENCAKKCEAANNYNYGKCKLKELEEGSLGTCECGVHHCKFGNCVGAPVCQGTYMPFNYL